MPRKKKEKFNANFLSIIERAVDAKKPILLRFKDRDGFMEVGPKFTRHLVNDARACMMLSMTGLEEPNALERLAIQILHDSVECGSIKEV